MRPEQLDAVLLVGGSSRIPLVSQLVSAELGRPIATDISPTTAVAIGAAQILEPQPARRTRPPAPVVAPRPGAGPGARPVAARSPGAAQPPGAAQSPGAAKPPAAGARPAAPRVSPAASPPATPPATPRPATPAAAQPPRRPTAVMPRAAIDAEPPRGPARSSAGALASSSARGAAAGGPTRERRWIPPVAAAIVGILAAAALIWLITNSGSGSTSSIGPKTTTATADPATTPATTTAATTPTPTAPPKLTVAGLRQDPCSALTPDQAAELDLRSPGRESNGIGCRWEGQNAPEVDVSAASGPDIYSDIINNPGGWAHLDRVEVAGRQAVRYGAAGSCSVTVRVSQNESITTSSRQTPQDQNGCDRATAAARAVLANF